MTVATTDAQHRPVDDLELYRISEAMRMLRMSRTVIYEQLRTGRLRSVRQGRARRIPPAAIREYIALLESEAGCHDDTEASV